MTVSATLQDPPAPPRAPAVVQTLHFLLEPLGFMRAYSRRYGDPFRTRIVGGLGECIWWSHPDAIRQIFTGDPEKFHAGETNMTLRAFLGPSSLLVLDGARHMRHRRLMLPPFHGQRMHAYGTIIRNVTERVARRLPLDGRAFTARRYMQEIALEVIIRAVFGIEEGALFDEFKRDLTEFLESVKGPLVFFPWLQRDLGRLSPWGRFKRAERAVDRLIARVLAERRRETGSSREDILTLLLAARDEEGGPPLDDAEIRDELLTLLAAGHETTATALSWALYWIHSTPGVCERLRQELGPFARDRDPEGAARLPYLDAVCKESLRLYPVIPVVGRKVHEEVEIGGVRVPPETNVLAAIFTTHHREDLYPEPERFRPERFLGRRFSPYEFLPFGGGVRRCVGEAFALYEMKIVLATLLARLGFALASARPPRPVRRGITVAPAGGVALRAKEMIVA